MSSPFSHDLGDGAALKGAARRLGNAGGDISAIESNFRDAQGGVIGSMYGSNYSMRLSELTDGLRGMDAEFTSLRTGAEKVAELMQAHGRDLEDLDQDLRRWEREVTRAENAAADLGAKDSSPEAATAHDEARRIRADREEDAREAIRRVERKISGLIAAVDSVTNGFNPEFKDISPAAIRRVSDTFTSATWVPRKLGDGTFTMRDAFTVLDFAHSTIAADEEAARLDSLRNNPLYQVGGGLLGFGEGLWGTGKDLYNLVRHPVDGAKGLWSFGKGLFTDPTGTVKGLWGALTDPIIEDWKNREYGHAIGLSLEGILEVVFGAKGTTKVTKLSKAKALRAMDRKARLKAFDLNTVPGWADGGRIPTVGPEGEMFRNYFRYADLTRTEFLRKYWDSRTGSWDYPPNNGFAGKPRPNTLQPGAVIDRFGPPTGSFASPVGTPFGKRAIPPGNIVDRPGAASPTDRGYHRYQVVKPLPKLVTQGKVAPWFGQKGGGTQFNFEAGDRNIQWYVDHGYLKRVKH